jgi:hypothetical protein
LERVKKNWGKQAFNYHAANDWNSLPMWNSRIYVKLKLLKLN